MDGMSCLPTLNYVVKRGHLKTSMDGISCLQALYHVVKTGYLWIGCPVQKQ